MRVLIVDQDGVGLSFALRANAAGHAVKWFVKPKPANSPDIGKGFKGIEKVDNWVTHTSWADLIFCTSNDDYIERLEFFSKRKCPVFAPSVASAKLEISRKDGMLAMEKVGIECAPYKTFPTMQAAERHVIKTDERFVFKTLGDNEDKALTYVSKSPADLVAWMRRTPPPKGEVMLQTFISGIEMGVSRFMGSKGWVGPWNESFEHKKLMPGNYGPNTGEMGTIAYFTPESKLGTDTLGKLESMLLKINHRGDTALGFIIDDKGKPWPTEWTCRLGWPIANMMLGAIKGDPVEWMRDALQGKDTTTFSTDIGCCLIMAHGDFPYGNFTKRQTNGVPIYGITKGVQQHVHPQAVQLMPLPDIGPGGKGIVEREMWATAGDYVGVITGYGASVSQATKRAYGTVEKLHVANRIVRDDIGEELKHQLPTLHGQGYAEHCNY
jgi:phosphoribosylamine--glycine ligase